VSLERNHAAVRGFHVRRGVFVPLNGQDRADAASYAASRKAARAIGSQHPHVMAEIERLRARPATGTNTILLLVVSAALFLAASSGRSSVLARLPRHARACAALPRGRPLAGNAQLRVPQPEDVLHPFLGAAVSGRH
jgi:hypothetical protein